MKNRISLNAAAFLCTAALANANASELNIDFELLANHRAVALCGRRDHGSHDRTA